MGIVSRLLGRSERRSASPYVDAFLRGDDLPNAWGSDGRVVTEQTALTSVTVYACVRLIAETVASMPLLLYQRTANEGRQRADSRSLYWLLHDDPNPEMSHLSFWEAIIGHLCTWGNAYAEIQRDADDQPVALWPLRPDRMSPVRSAAGQLSWSYRMTTGPAKPFQQRDILNIPGFGSNGITGYSPIALHAQAIGLALDTESYGSRFFKNDSRPGGVLQTKEKMGDEAFERLKASWEEAHRGAEGAHRIAILEEGVTWQQVGIPNNEAQFLETRSYERSELASIWRVPPHMIGDVDKSTSWGTGIEQQAIGFVTHTLRPVAERVEEAIERCLLPPADRRTYFVEHLFDGLLRGDQKSRMESYAIMRNWGLRSPNDIARLENWQPIPADQGGDTYLQPLNMVPAGQPAEPAPAAGRAARQERARWPVGSAESRRRIADRYERLLKDAAGRIVRREAAEVRETARRMLSTRDAESFRSWLARYYGDFGAYAARTMTPSFLAYGEAIEEDAAAELGEDAAFASVEAWLHAYATTFGLNYAGRSRGQLEQVLDQATADETDQLAAVETRLDEWGDTRPRKVSSVELTRLAGALVIATWKPRGVKKLQWVSIGKSCAFCVKLDGRIMGIEHEFFHPGDTVEGDEQTGNFTADRPVRHPPIHGFCNCGLRAVREG